MLDKLPAPADPAWRSPSADPRRPARVPDRPGEPIELWAWIAAYDHVVLAQLWGDMRALPRPIPRFTHELRQRWEDAGPPAAARRARRTRTTRWPTPGTTWRKWEVIDAIWRERGMAS